MSQLTWLHLSDFHFSGEAHYEDAQREAMPSSLALELAKEGLRPDLVFVTGDIAATGKAAEYERAIRFFQKMSEDLSVPRERWFLVPGNHDVDRGRVDGLSNGLRNLLEQSDAPMSEPRSWSMMADRMDAYLRFTRNFLGKERGWEAVRPWRTEHVTVHDWRLAILGLNSAWASQDDDDRGRLLLSEFQVRDALEQANRKEPELKITLMHHPFDYLREWDMALVNQLLVSENGCHFLLRGHLHQTDLQQRIRPGASIWEIAAGAFWQGSEAPHAVNVVQLEHTGDGSIHVFKYVNKEGGFWRRHTTIYKKMPEGYWPFTLRGTMVPKDAGTRVGRLYWVPPLPEKYFKRKNIVDRILREMETSKLIGMHGLGGIGKSELVKEVANSRRTKRRFPDGIFWVDFGLEPEAESLPVCLAEIIKVLSKLPPSNRNLETLIKSLNMLLSKSVCLLIIDDPWLQSQVESFRVSEGRSRVLFTTRSVDFVKTLGAKPFKLECLSDVEGRDFFNYLLDRPDDLPDLVLKVSCECGGLPLALSICAALSTGTYSWQNILNKLLQGEIGLLNEPEYKGVSKSIEISLDSLKDEERNTYLSLAVFPREAIPIPAVITYLCSNMKLDESTARQRLNRFANLSLLQISDGSPKTISIHSLFRHYIRDKRDLVALHQRLVASYYSGCKGDWHTVPDDGYFYKHLTYHLIEAKKLDALRELLKSTRWQEKICNMGKVGDLVADVAVSHTHLSGDILDVLANIISRKRAESFNQQFREALKRYFGPYPSWPSDLIKSFEVSNHVNVLRFLGDTASLANNHEQGQDYYEKALQIEDDYSLHVRIATILVRRKEPKKALKRLQHIYNKYPNPSHKELMWAKYQEGICLRDDNRHMEAEKVFTEVWKSGGSRHRYSAYYQLGVLALNKNDLDSAERIFHDSKKERDSLPWNHRRAFENRRLGQVYAKRNQLVLACQYFHTALEISDSCGNERYSNKTLDDILDIYLKPLLEKNSPDICLADLENNFGIKQTYLARALRRLEDEDKFLEVICEKTAEPTGRVARSNHIHEMGEWHATIAVLVFDKDGRLALQKRGESDSWGKWDLSVTGHQEVGESDIETAVRETREELTLDIHPDRFSRFGQPHQFKKIGGVGKSVDLYDNYCYVYSTNKRNSERISLFILCITESEKDKIQTGDAMDVQQVRWCMLDKVTCLIDEDPDNCASSIKHIFCPPRFNDELLDTIKSYGSKRSQRFHEEEL